MLHDPLPNHRVERLGFRCRESATGARAMRTDRRHLLLALVLCCASWSCPARAATAEDWQIPVMRRAVLWLLYDDWGQERRVYGSERIEATAHDRQKPDVLRAAKTIHLDASGWGTRAPFTYNAATRTVVPAPPNSKPLNPSESIRISVQKHPTHYMAKLWWGNQLFFIHVQYKNGQTFVSEFTEHMLTLGAKPR